MKNFTPRLLSGLALALLAFSSLFGQLDPFQSTRLASIPPGVREIEPTRAQYYQADTLALHQLLFAAPLETSAAIAASETFLELPTPDGSTLTFQLVRYPMLEPGLAEKFPGIVNLYGREVGKGQRRIRLDWTYRGFHAVVRGGPEGDWYVDPVYAGNRLHYQVYTRSALTAPAQRPICGVSDTLAQVFPTTAETKIGDCTFRSYRLAVATTGEYYANQGNTNTAVLSTINTTVSRVNEVTEIDLATRFVLVADNHKLLFSNGATDPYDDTDANQMLNANTGVVNDSIGSGNYDIGHVFSWDGSGLARLQSVCNNVFKGQGTTSRNGLVGDAFYIDYVAHEFGHQMGASHTFNAAGNGNCTSSSRSAGNSFEPGSGSTIMAYAGICSGANVQLSSDAYFHVGSLVDIANFMELGTGASCATTINLSNNAPAVSAGDDHTIPANTPFVLTAVGSDVGGNPLSYTWEQYDAMTTGYSGPPSGAETGGPLFRSLLPASSPSRYFPNLTDLTAGSSPTWETLPTTGRSLTFRVTARDGAAGFGCAVFDQTALTVVSSTGFAVSQPTGGEVWPVNSTQTVSWNVAGTGSGTSINCENVDILLSTDGGMSYGTVLASNVSNNGTHAVTIPNAVGANNRIQVRCADNVFFNISPQDFTISAQTYILSTSSPTASFCTNEAILLPVTVESLESYAGTVTLSVTSSLPGGATASFATNPVTVGVGDTETSVLELSNVPAGDYTIEVSGTDGATQRTLEFDITVKQGVRAVTLLSPAESAVVDPDDAPTFSWTADDEASDYRWRLYDSEFSLLGQLSTANTSVNINLSDRSDGTYYWDVGVRDSACNGDYSQSSSLRQVLFSRTQLASPERVQTRCAGGAATQDYSIVLTGGGSLSGTVSFTTGGLPVGVSGSFSPGTLTNSGTTQLTLSGVDKLAAGNYDFQVMASDAGDSETLDLRLTVLSVPAAVSALSPPVGSFQTDRSLTFTWTDDPGADNYIIAVSTNSDMSSPLLTASPKNPTIGITFENFSDGATVYWQVTAQGSCGSPADSPVFNFTFGNAPLPVTWIDFRASASTDHIALEWQVEEWGGNEGFAVERSMDGRRFETIGWVPAVAEEGIVDYEYPDREVVTGQGYFYRLLQRDRDGQVSYSPIREARLAGDQLAIELRPNPARESIQLRVNTTESPARYMISDAYGRVLLQGQLAAPQQPIDLHRLPPGQYYLRYTAGGHSVIKRLVKLR